MYGSVCFISFAILLSAVGSKSVAFPQKSTEVSNDFQKPANDSTQHIIHGHFNTTLKKSNNSSNETENVVSYSLILVPCKDGYKKIGSDCVLIYD